MPSATDFKKYFRLGSGEALFASATKCLGQITSSNVGHEVKEQNERYEFPTTLEIKFKNIGDKPPTRRQLESALRKKNEEDLVVYSAYGSPYQCSISGVKVTEIDDNHAKAKLTGKALRRRDIPTLGKQKEEERKRKAGSRKGLAPDEVSEEDAAKWLGDMRVIKSRFATSKCSECGETIVPGVKIAKDAASKSRGGWAHVACAMAARKAQNRGRQKRRRKR